MTDAQIRADARPICWGSTGEPYFIEWLNGFYQRALQSPVCSRALLDRELSGLSSDPRITALDAQQPEFARPISTYIDGDGQSKAHRDRAGESATRFTQFPVD